jgi:hypothetical protein
MGTNYYWRDAPCNECGRYDEHHVGKSSAGWSFGFRAYPHLLSSDEHPEWGHYPCSPFGFPVLTRADWRRVFTERTGQLWDEYRRLVDDPVVWLDGLKPPGEAAREWEDGMLGSSTFRVPADTEWRDPEGFHFYAGEFS